MWGIITHTCLSSWQLWHGWVITSHCLHWCTYWSWRWFYIRAHFLSLSWSKLRLCSDHHRPGYWSNMPCDWLSTAWAYSEQEIQNGPRSALMFCLQSESCMDWCQGTISGLSVDQWHTIPTRGCPYTHPYCRRYAPTCFVDRQYEL